MSQLARRHAAHAFDEGSDRLEGFDLFIVPDAQAARGDAAARLNRRGFSENQANPAAREGAEMGEMPVVGDAVFAGIHAQRRQNDTIGQGDAAQGQRREQLG